MLYFNSLFENNPAPVAYHISPNKPTNVSSSSTNTGALKSNVSANISKTSSSSGTNNTITSSDRAIANLVKDTRNL